MDGDLEVSAGEAEGLPRVIGDEEGLIEAGGKGLKTGSVGGGGDGSVNNGVGDGAFAIDKGVERNRELGVGLFEDGGSNVGEADVDEGLVRVGGVGSMGGVKPSGSAGEGRRVFRRRGPHDGRDFGRCSPRTGGALAFSLTLSGVFGSRLVELTSASVNDGSIGGARGGTRVGRGSVGGVGPVWTRRGCMEVGAG